MKKLNRKKAVETLIKHMGSMEKSYTAQELQYYEYLVFSIVGNRIKESQGPAALRVYFKEILNAPK